MKGLILKSREGLDDFQRPEDLDITRYTRRGYESSRLPSITHFIQNERLFEHVIDDGLNEERIIKILDDVIFLKHLMVITGCYHQCTFCGQDPGMNITNMYEQDFNYLVDTLEQVVEVAGIPQYHSLSDISFHRDGEALMYLGRKSPEDIRKGDLADMIYRVKNSLLFDRTKEKADRIRICTAGVYDQDEENTITTTIQKMMDNIDTYFGTDKKTGSKGGIRFSFHTGTLYLKPGGHLGISPPDWKQILVDNFRLFLPLFEEGRFGVRIKEAEDTPRNVKFLHGYDTERMWNLFWDVWNQAGYGDPKLARQKNPKSILYRTITASGRGRAFDNAVPYEGCDPAYVMELNQLRRGVPVVYILPKGMMVREVPKVMRQRDKRKNIIRQTKLSLPSQWK